jgi:hypothetical protein
MSDASFIGENVSQPLAPARDAGSTWSARVARLWHASDALLAGLSDWVNPILVKETRQALRSWQFALTFILLLVACWVVTFGGIAVIGPSVYYAAGGGELLRAYFLVLSLPLLVVVPFAAFRSLAAEREENTYDLVSITTLRPRQIIGGKLASSVLQMIMFFSAITPCLAFTYLLRGVDTPTIALLLAYTFLASFALSVTGLLLATLSRQRYAQLMMSVAFVALLLYVCYGAQLFAAELVQQGFELYVEPNFWVANFFGLLLYATTMALAYLAATAMITFPTENRSTPLRIAMLLEQAALVAALAWIWIETGYESDVIWVLAVASGAYWFLMGTMLNGEQPQMSRRVLRSLPQSTLGRAFFTWLQPGPSSGYMFAVANVTAIVLLALIPAVIVARSNVSNSTWPNPDRFLSLLVIGWSYVVAYLGLGCLVVALLRKVSEVTMFASVLLHLLLMLAGSGIPTSIHWMSVELQSEPYSYLQITNPIWTLEYIHDFSPAPEEPMLLIVVPAAALCVLLLNLPGIARELQRVRTELPVRVAEDEVELHPPPESLPQNPWEAEE